MLILFFHTFHCTRIQKILKMSASPITHTGFLPFGGHPGCGRAQTIPTRPYKSNGNIRQKTPV